MGGLVEDAPASGSRNRFVPSEDDISRARSESRDLIRDEVFAQQGDPFVGSAFWKLYDEMQVSGVPVSEGGLATDTFGGYSFLQPFRSQADIASDMYQHFVGLGYTPAQAQRVVGRAMLEAPSEMKQKIHVAKAVEADREAVFANAHRAAGHPPRRYLMSDEMRRRLIEAGVGASVLAPLLMQDGE